jgi:hypothetical protein
MPVCPAWGILLVKPQIFEKDPISLKISILPPSKTCRFYPSRSVQLKEKESKSGARKDMQITAQLQTQESLDHGSRREAKIAERKAKGPTHNVVRKPKWERPEPYLSCYQDFIFKSLDCNTLRSPDLTRLL